jgi:hypothetical protein
MICKNLLPPTRVLGVQVERKPKSRENTGNRAKEDI